jgi:hypothetical protein
MSEKWSDGINQRSYRGSEPVPEPTPTIVYTSLVPEMTLRDYFAGQAIMAAVTMQETELAGIGLRAEQQNYLAMLAYEIADAMIEARKK